MVERVVDTGRGRFPDRVGRAPIPLVRSLTECANTRARHYFAARLVASPLVGGRSTSNLPPMSSIRRRKPGDAMIIRDHRTGRITRGATQSRRSALAWHSGSSRRWPHGLRRDLR
jgi:hypothetical protein